MLILGIKTTASLPRMPNRGVVLVLPKQHEHVSLLRWCKVITWTPEAQHSLWVTTKGTTCQWPPNGNLLWNWNLWHRYIWTQQQCFTLEAGMLATRNSGCWSRTSGRQDKQPNEIHSTAGKKPYVCGLFFNAIYVYTHMHLPISLYTKYINKYDMAACLQCCLLCCASPLGVAFDSTR